MISAVSSLSKLNIQDKLYIWSLITEPLLFFVLLQSNVLGIPLTLSRVLQFAFLMTLLYKYIQGSRITCLDNLLSLNYQYIYIFTFILLLSSFIGVFSGSYIYVSEISNHDNIKAALLSGKYLRPFFELFILVYYFVYFLIIPKHIITTPSHLNYLMRWMKNIFAFVVIVGLVDVACNIIGFDLIPRHLVDSRWVEMGIRFHSVIGEPRDAFVYLVFMMCVLYLYTGIENKSPPKLSAVVVIAICLFLTQSFSGLVGICFSLLLLIVFTKIPKEHYKITLLLVFISAVVGFVALRYSLRINFFMQMTLTIPEILRNGTIEPYLVGVHFPTDIVHAQHLASLVTVQAPDIIPLWLVYNRIHDFELYEIIFGSGIGSASYAINNFVHATGVNNPRSQFARLIFETGIIGLYFYMVILIQPIKQLKLLVSRHSYLIILISAIFLYGALLAHRSNLGLIFAGIVMAVIKVNFNIAENKDKDGQLISSEK